jgi:hypothetical protein
MKPDEEQHAIGIQRHRRNPGDEMLLGNRDPLPLTSNWPVMFGRSMNTGESA